jgi:hypothetical protein
MMMRIVMAYSASGGRTGHPVMMCEMARHCANCRTFQTTASEHG